MARIGNAVTWVVDYYSQTSSYMTGLVIIGDVSTCVSGFIFYFSDGSSMTEGVSYNQTSSMLAFTNPSGLTEVNSYAGLIIDLLEICNSYGVCVKAGKNGSIANYNITISSTWNITSFWGSFSNYNGITCLQSFGIYYTHASPQTTTATSYFKTAETGIVFFS